MYLQVLMFVSKCFDKLSFSFWKINFDGKNFGQFGEEKKSVLVNLTVRNILDNS